MTTLTDDRAILLQQWLDDLKALLAQVQGWCDARGWIATPGDKPVVEPKFGEYTAPMLQLRAQNGIVVFVEPVARDVAGGDGLVDIYAWPSIRRFLLARLDGEWSVRTDSGVPLPWKWSDKTFLDVIEALTSAR